jgi:hypothetical protein
MNTSASKTSTMPSCYYKKAVKEVKAIPNCQKTYSSGGYSLYETPLFYIRILDNEENVQIQLAERKTFDRWANSVNFAVDRSKTPKHYFPLFFSQYNWAIKVLKSKLFNFNSYIGAIELPWFETGRNR